MLNKKLKIGFIILLAIILITGCNDMNEEEEVIIESKPSAGFHWDYFLYIPDTYDPQSK